VGCGAAAGAGPGIFQADLDFGGGGGLLEFCGREEDGVEALAAELVGGGGVGAA
jgi:hypothetical protein